MQATCVSAAAAAFASAALAAAGAAAVPGPLDWATAPEATGWTCGVKLEFLAAEGVALEPALACRRKDGAAAFVMDSGATDVRRAFTIGHLAASGVGDYPVAWRIDPASVYSDEVQLGDFAGSRLLFVGEGDGNSLASPQIQTWLTLLARIDVPVQFERGGRAEQHIVSFNLRAPLPRAVGRRRAAIAAASETLRAWAATLALAPGVKLLTGAKYEARRQPPRPSPGLEGIEVAETWLTGDRGRCALDVRLLPLDGGPLRVSFRAAGQTVLEPGEREREFTLRLNGAPEACAPGEHELVAEADLGGGSSPIVRTTRYRIAGREAVASPVAAGPALRSATLVAAAGRLVLVATPADRSAARDEAGLAAFVELAGRWREIGPLRVRHEDTWVFVGKKRKLAGVPRVQVRRHGTPGPAVIPSQPADSRGAGRP